MNSLCMAFIESLLVRKKSSKYDFMRICFTDVFFVFFCFFHPSENMRQPFSGTAECRIFMKLLANDSRENVVCITVLKLGLGPRFLGAKNYTLRTWW